MNVGNSGSSGMLPSRLKPSTGLVKEFFDGTKNVSITWDKVSILQMVKCTNRNKSHLLFSFAEMFKKPLQQTVWT